MSSKIELTYFPLRARGEPAALALAYSKLPWEARVVSFEEWPTVKPTVPAGKTGQNQLPVLRRLDGTVIPETVDIALYVAEASATTPGAISLKADAASADAVAALLAATFDPPVVMGNPIASWFSKEEAEPKIAEYAAGTTKWLNEKASAHGLGERNPYFFGATPTAADFGVFHALDLLLGLSPASAKELSPKLLDFFRRIRNLPGVKEYLASRPQAATGKVGRPGSKIAVDDLDAAVRSAL